MNAHDHFIEPAQAKREWWRLILGIFVTIGLWVGLVSIGYVVTDRWPDLLGFLPKEPNNGQLLEMLAGLAALWPAMFISIRLVHRRTLTSIIGPFGLEWDAFWRGAGCFVIYMLIMFIPAYLVFPPVVPYLDFNVWLTLVPLAIVLIFLQSGAEELLFRGYLQQELAVRAPLWVAIIIPSILFALGHYSDIFGPNLGYLYALMMLSGLITADLTRRTGSISMAWGLHFANNLAAVLLIGFDMGDGGLSLWIDPTSFNDVEMIRLNLVFSMAAMCLTYALLLWYSQGIAKRAASQ